MKQPPRFGLIADRRQIIDRRALAAELENVSGGGLQAGATAILQSALDRGREEIARRLSLEPGRGRVIAASYCFLSDQIVRSAYDFVTTRIHPRPRGATCRLSIVGLGGTGRGEMAPFSDLDLMFLVPERGSEWCGKVVEAWATPAELDIAGFRSNTFELEHPKGSGVMRSYPEVDRVEWFDFATAQRKINSGQVGLLLELQRLLGVGI